MPERLNGPDSKSVGRQRHGGSNPSPSATSPSKGCPGNRQPRANAGFFVPVASRSCRRIAADPRSVWGHFGPKTEMGASHGKQVSADRENQGCRVARKPCRPSGSKGLHLEVTPSSGRLRRSKYRHAGREECHPLGECLAVGLSLARTRHVEAWMAVKDDRGHRRPLRGGGCPQAAPEELRSTGAGYADLGGPAQPPVAAVADREHPAIRSRASCHRQQAGLATVAWFMRHGLRETPGGSFPSLPPVLHTGAVFRPCVPLARRTSCHRTSRAGRQDASGSARAG